MKKITDKYVLNKQFEVAGWNETTNKLDNSYPNVPQEEHDRISHETKKERAPIKTETILNRLDELKKTNPDLHKILIDSWILKNWIENTGQLEKLEKFINYLNYLYGVTRVSDTNPSETSQEISSWGKTNIVKKYRELLSEKTDFIMNKEFLQYKYMEAIIRDIKRMWFFIQKNDNWSYIVKELNSWKEVNNSKIWVYADVFKVESINNHAIDTALLSNVIVSNKEFDWVLNQKQFINKLFQKYGIISNVKDEDKTNYLIVKWAEIEKQIHDKIVKSKSWQEISELSILQNFVKNKTWEDNSSYERFNKANTYAKWFLTEKSFIDAYKSGALSWLDDPKKSTEDKISDIIKGNQVTAWLFGILAMIFGFKKTWIAALWFWFFWWAAADLLSDTTKVWKDLINGWESIIKPIEKDQIWKLLSKSEYQDKYQNLITNNSKTNDWDLKKSWDIYIDNTMNQLDWLRLTKLIEYIILNEIDFNLNDINIEDKLQNKITWSTPEEINSLVILLKSEWIWEEWDETILDYLTKNWKDILNKPFESIYPTWLDIFDKEINTILKNEFDKVDNTRKDKLKILKVKEKISNEFDILNKITNGAKDLINGSDLSNKATDSVLSYLRSEFPSLEDSLKPTFENFEKYIKAEDELTGFEGLYDENILDLQSKIQSIFGTSNTRELYDKLNFKVSELVKIIIKEPLLLSIEPFKNLNTKIYALISNLEKSKDELIKESRKTDNPISDDWSNTSSEDYYDNPELLYKKISDSLKKVENVLNSLNSDNSLFNIEKQLSKIEKDYKNLINAGKNIAKTEYYSMHVIDKNFQSNIDETLNNFNIEKEKLETYVKKSLLDFYKSNNIALKEIDSIEKDIENELDVKNIIDKLAKTKKFLASNDIEVWVKNKLENEILDVKQSITKHDSTTIDSDIEKVIDDYLTKIWKLFDTTWGYISNSYSILETTLWVEIAELKKYVASKWLTAPDTTKIEKSLEDLFKARSKDEQAIKVLEKANKVLGSDFSIESSTSIKDVEKSYLLKITELNEWIKTYLDWFVIATNTDDLKEQAKLMKSIKGNFWLEESYIEKILDNIALKYIEITNVGKDNAVITYINEVYNYNWTDKAILAKVQNFKKEFNSLDVVVKMNIKDFLSKISNIKELKEDVNQILTKLDIYK